MLSNFSARQLGSGPEECRSRRQIPPHLARRSKSQKVFQERASGDDLLRRSHPLHSGGGGEGDHVPRRREAVHGVQRVGDERRPADKLRTPGMRYLPEAGARVLGRQRQAEVW